MSMPRRKSHLTLKLGPAKQREVFNEVLLSSYLLKTGREQFTSDEEKREIMSQLDVIWDREFKKHTSEFASLTVQELESIFSEIDISIEDEGGQSREENFERADHAATAAITIIPLGEIGFPLEKLQAGRAGERSFSELDIIKVKWAYDVAIRVARYALEDDKEIRKCLRKEIHGLLSAYLTNKKIIPVRDRMIKEYKNQLLIQ